MLPISSSLRILKIVSFVESSPSPIMAISASELVRKSVGILPATELPTIIIDFGL